MTRPMFSVFAIRKGKIWSSAGRAVQNADGSINVALDVLPLDGQLHLRPLKAPAEAKKPEVFVVRGSETLAPGRDLVAMLQHPDGRTEQIAVLTHGLSHPVDLIFNQAANLALNHGANLSSDWLRSWQATTEPQPEGGK